MGQLLWIPAIASVVMFALCWWADIIERPGVVGTWCAIGLTMQVAAFALSPGVPGVGRVMYRGVPLAVMLGPYVLVWLIGLLISAFVAIYLSVILKTG